jgi:hypothetical protein
MDEANLASAAVTIKPTVNADLRWGAYLSMRKDYRAQHEWIASGWPSGTVLEFDRPRKSKLHQSELHTDVIARQFTTVTPGQRPR